jgi:hypothetical protein
MKTTRSTRRSWLYGLLALVALLLGAPRADAAIDYAITYVTTVTFSNDPTCFDAGDARNITITAGTTVYACVNIARGSAEGGPASSGIGAATARQAGIPRAAQSIPPSPGNRPAIAV